MAGPIAFQQLVEALVTALLEAQDRIEVHQLSLLRSYFDDQDRPRNAFIKVPSLSYGADQDVTLRVPLLALIHPNLLKIKDAELTFDVDLTDFSAPVAQGAPPKTAASRLGTEAGKFPPRDEAPPMLTVAIPSGGAKERLSSAKIVLRVEGQEPSEGLARVIHELVKRIGGEHG